MKRFKHDLAMQIVKLLDALLLTIPFGSYRLVLLDIYNFWENI